MRSPCRRNERLRFLCICCRGSLRQLQAPRNLERPATWKAKLESSLPFYPLADYGESIHYLLSTHLTKLKQRGFMDQYGARKGPISRRDVRSRLSAVAGFAIGLLLGVSVLVATDSEPARAGVVSESDVAPVWSVHATGAPVLLTTASYQYVAYYDQNEFLTVAQRTIDGAAWAYHKFSNIQSTWQTLGHHLIAMQIDSSNIVHIAAAMHAEPLKYFRMTSPNDLNSFVQYSSLVGSDESQVSYPVFLKDAAGKLFLTYRSGVSGNGIQLLDGYNAATRTWTRVVPTWFDGASANESAYIYGPTLGPDGKFHISWVWRNTGDVSTNHDVSYASSPDLVHWSTASGSAITLPITPSTPGDIADPVPVNGGLFNGFTEVGFDSTNRVVLVYPKYDPSGDTQLYAARYESGSWHIVKETSWSYRWNVSGTGAQPLDIIPSPASPNGSGQLNLDFTHVKYGVGRVSVDDDTLNPINVVYGAQVTQSWPESLNVPETVSPPRPMTVDWVPDLGQSAVGERYVLRWEHGPINNDAPVAQPWPAPTMLRVIKLNGSQEAYTTANLAADAPVSASSSYELSGWSTSRLTDAQLFSAVGAAGYSSNSSTTVNHSEWVQVDLGAPVLVSQVSLFPTNASGYGMPVTFTVDTSSNGSSWTTAVSKTNQPLVAGEQTSAFGAVKARYVRISASSLRANPNDSNQYRLQFAEMQVLGSRNLAQGMPTSATSSKEGSGFALLNVNNGDTSVNTAGWTSDANRTANHQESLTVDLGASQSVSDVTMYPCLGGNFYPLDFSIAVSNDGSTWTTTLTRTAEAIPADRGDYTFAPTTARYVKIVFTSLRQWAGDSNQYRVQLAELEIRP